MFKLASLFVEIGAQDSALNRALAGIKGRLADIARTRFSVPGGGLMSALGLTGVVAGMAGVISTASDMESRIAALGKAADLEGSALAKMKGDLLALSTSIKGVRINDLIDIAIAGAKMGIAGGDLLRYSEGIAKVSTAIDDMPAGEIADRIGKLNTVFKLGVDGTMKLGSAIDKLADSGVSSSSGILDVTARISGSAVVSKITAQETTALAAALLDTGTRSEEAASSLLDLISSLNQVNGRIGMAKAIGTDSKEFARLVEGRPIEAIQKYLGALKKMDAAVQLSSLASIGIKGDTHAAEIQKLSQQSEKLGQYVGQANHEFKTLDQITKSYGASVNLTKSQWITAQNQVQILAERIGSALLPSINTGLSLIGDLATGLGGMFDESRKAVEGWGVDFSGVTESVSAAFRNLGDIFQRTGIMIGGSLQNAWEYLSYGGEVAGATGKYIWESLVEAFDISLVAAANLKDNLVSLFKEIWDYVSSGFNDPIEVRFKPLLEGIKLKGDGQFKMPELNLSSVENQLEEVDKRVREREEKRVADREGAGKKAGAGGGGAAGGGGGSGDTAASTAKVGVTDADTYARELQDGALKAGETQKDILKEAQAQTKLLTNLDKNIAEAGPNRGGVAMATFA